MPPPLPAALEPVTPARVIHQDVAHRARRHREEVGAVGPSLLFLIGQPEVGLMDERRGLQGVARLPARQITTGHPVQLIVDQGQHGLDRRLVSLPLSAEHLRDLL